MAPVVLVPAKVGTFETGVTVPLHAMLGFAPAEVAVVVVVVVFSAAGSRNCGGGGGGGDGASATAG